jgi:hypothetical protein
MNKQQRRGDSVSDEENAAIAPEIVNGRYPLTVSEIAMPASRSLDKVCQLPTRYN